jgi:hypothetical protein
MLALFNKNKNLIGYGEDIPENPNLKIYKKEIPEDKKDLTKWRWVGDFDTGQMVSIKNNPFQLSYEQERDFIFNKIYNNYPIDTQLIILMKQVRTLCENTSLLTDEFKNMSDLIFKAVDIHNKADKSIK